MHQKFIMYIVCRAAQRYAAYSWLDVWTYSTLIMHKETLILYDHAHIITPVPITPHGE